MSVGVWVGLIALMGVDAETGIFMLLYIDLAVQDWKLQAGCAGRPTCGHRAWGSKANPAK